MPILSRRFAPLLFPVVFSEDPWINRVWLPQHKEWKTIMAGPEPANCSNP